MVGGDGAVDAHHLRLEAAIPRRAAAAEVAQVLLRPADEGADGDRVLGVAQDREVAARPGGRVRVRVGVIIRAVGHGAGGAVLRTRALVRCGPDHGVARDRRRAVGQFPAHQPVDGLRGGFVGAAVHDVGVVAHLRVVGVDRFVPGGGIPAAVGGDAGRGRHAAQLERSADTAGAVGYAVGAAAGDGAGDVAAVAVGVVGRARQPSGEVVVHEGGRVDASVEDRHGDAAAVQPGVKGGGDAGVGLLRGVDVEVGARHVVGDLLGRRSLFEPAHFVARGDGRDRYFGGHDRIDVFVERRERNAETVQRILDRRAGHVGMEADQQLDVVPLIGPRFKLPGQNFRVDLVCGQDQAEPAHQVDERGGIRVRRGRDEGDIERVADEIDQVYADGCQRGAIGVAGDARQLGEGVQPARALQRCGERVVQPGFRREGAPAQRQLDLLGSKLHGVDEKLATAGGHRRRPGVEAPEQVALLQLDDGEEAGVVGHGRHAHAGCRRRGEGDGDAWLRRAVDRDDLVAGHSHAGVKLLAGAEVGHFDGGAVHRLAVGVADGQTQPAKEGVAARAQPHNRQPRVADLLEEAGLGIPRPARAGVCADDDQVGRVQPGGCGGTRRGRRTAATGDDGQVQREVLLRRRAAESL